jgi:hypothetical protein
MIRRDPKAAITVAVLRGGRRVELELRAAR